MEMDGTAGLKAKGAFVQVLDPAIVTEKVGEPRYLFKSDELRFIAASIYYYIPLEQRHLLPALRGRSDHFPYRSYGMYFMAISTP